MKKLIIAGFAIAMCLAVFSSNAMSAEKAAEFGARLGFINCSGCDGSLLIGADYFIPVAEKDELDVRLTFASVDVFDIWSLSGNYIYNLPREAGASGSWYAGAGLGVMRFSSKTKIGGNLMGGYKFENNISAEASYTRVDAENFWGISLGYRF
ncbi:MAG: hypothetical protein WCX65_05960 [bacterium]